MTKRQLFNIALHLNYAEKTRPGIANQMCSYMYLHIWIPLILLFFSLIIIVENIYTAVWIKPHTMLRCIMFYNVVFIIHVYSCSFSKTFALFTYKFSQALYAVAYNVMYVVFVGVQNDVLCTWFVNTFLFCSKMILWYMTQLSLYWQMAA